MIIYTKITSGSIISIFTLQHNINYVATDGSNEPDWTNLKKGALVSDGL